MKDKFKVLYEIAKLLNSMEEVIPLLNRIMDIAIDTVKGERGFIVVKEEGDLSIKIARRIDEKEIYDFSKSIINYSLENNESVIVKDFKKDERFKNSESAIYKGIRSVLCVPLRFRDEPIGVIYVDKKGGSPFDEEDLEFMELFSELAGVSVRNALNRETLLKENVFMMQELGRIYGVPRIVGKSEKMKEIFNLMAKVIPSSSPVLIEGESGTGKELIARMLHFAGPRAKKKFVAVNVSTLPESLIESELFGYKKGAFTGAVSDKEGLIAVADGGTLFLDEISEMPLHLQVKILRVIETKEYIPLGDTKVRKANVRIIAATNKDLLEEVKKGRFRADLYYRLNVIKIKLPPLRERKEDIPLLVSYFIEELNRKSNKRIRGIEKEAMDLLLNYDYPGNIRELRNIIERAYILCESERIRREDIFIEKGEPESRPYMSLSLEEHIKKHVLNVLNKCGNNKTKASKILGVSRRWLYYKLREWGIKDIK